MTAMTRRLRFAAAIFALFGMLFAQLAVPAHACAVDAGIVQAADDVHACCDGASGGDGEALCQAHCQQGDQSLDKPSGAVAQLAAVAALAAPVAEPPASKPPLPSLLTRATAPPAALLHCRLRF